MRLVSRQSSGKYAVAVGAVAAVFVIKLAINQLVHIEAPFLFFFAAIVISTWYGGFGPGLVAAFLGAIAAAPFFAIGVFQSNTSSVDLFQLVLFFLEALLIVGLTGSLRETQTQRQTTESAKAATDALLDTFQVYAPIGLAFLDNDLRYVRINYAMAELNGLTPAAHIGRTIQEVQPQIEPEVIANIQQVIETGKPLLDQELTVSKLTMLGMKQQHLLTSYYRVRSADGVALGVGAVMVDITRIKQAQEALRESKQRYQVTLASIGDAVIATDRQGQVTFINRIAEDLTGWQQPDVLGKPLEEVFKIVNEQSRATVENPAVKVLREGRVVGLANHTVLISKTGHETPIDDSGAPIPGEDGEVAGVVLVFRDVTERKRTEQRQRFLYDASNLLSSSLDYEITLQNVTRLAVPALADWCIVHLREGDEIRQVAIYHADAERAALREEMMRRYPPIASDTVSHTAVIESGEPQLLEEVSDELLQAAAVNDEHLSMLRELQYKSSLSVPLKNPDGVFGALTLRTNKGGRALTDDDLTLGIELGHLVSLAIENAHLYLQAQNNHS